MRGLLRRAKVCRVAHATVLPEGVRLAAAGIVLLFCLTLDAVVISGRVRWFGSGSHALLGLVGVALLVHIAAIITSSTNGDTDSFRAVGDALRSGKDIYSPELIHITNYPPIMNWWWTFAAIVTPNDSGWWFAAVSKIPACAADIGMAFVVIRVMGGGERGMRAGWLAATNPAIVAVSAMASQIDALVALPLVAAVVVRGRRPGIAGALLGLGVAIKTWPVFFVPTILLRTRWRSWVRFCAGAGAAVLAAFASYAVVHPSHLFDAVRRITGYHNSPIGFRNGLPDPQHRGGRFGCRGWKHRGRCCRDFARHPRLAAALECIRRPSRRNVGAAGDLPLNFAAVPHLADSLLLLAGRGTLVVAYTAGILWAMWAMWAYEAAAGSPPVWAFLLADVTVAAAAAWLIFSAGRVSATGEPRELEATG